MIKREKLKCPLYVLTFLSFAIVIAQAVVIIMQPIMNYIGFDWGDFNTNIAPNDGNGDQKITCPDSQYLTWKKDRGRYIFIASYSMMIIAFICGIYIFTVLCIHFFVFKGKDYEIEAKKQEREFYKRMGSLKGLYDQYFTYPMMVTLYLAISIAFIAQLVQVASCASMFRVYENCQKTRDGNLVALIVIGSIILTLLALSWILLQWFRYQLHKFFTKNELKVKASESYIGSDFSEKPKQNKVAKPIPMAQLGLQSRFRKNSIKPKSMRQDQQDNIHSTDRMLVPTQKLQNKSAKNSDSENKKPQEQQKIIIMNNNRTSNSQSSKRPIPQFLMNFDDKNQKQDGQGLEINTIVESEYNQNKKLSKQEISDFGGRNRRRNRIQN